MFHNRFRFAQFCPAIAGPYFPRHIPSMPQLCFNKTCFQIQIGHSLVQSGQIKLEPSWTAGPPAPVFSMDRKQRSPLIQKDSLHLLSLGAELLSGAYDQNLWVFECCVLYLYILLFFPLHGGCNGTQWPWFSFIFCDNVGKQIPSVPNQIDCNYIVASVSK